MLLGALLQTMSQEEVAQCVLKGNVLLKQVCPGRSTKKSQLGRGRAGDGPTPHSPHLPHVQL